MDHGVYYSELGTRLTPMTSISAPTIVVGTSAIHKAAAPAINKPVLCYTFDEYKEYLGYDGDYDQYTLDEAADCFFKLFNVAPIIFINVLKSKKTGTKTIEGLSNPIKLTEPIILSTLQVKSGNTELTAQDFTARYVDGQVELVITAENKITGDKATLTYQEVDASSVTASDIIAGIGLVEEIYPRFQLMPGTLIAPKWSKQTGVAAAMKAQCENINGCFKTICAVDMDATSYTDCAQVKSANNFVDSNMLVCWPKVSLDGTQYHLSTQVAALMNRIDADYDSLPFVSPSNHNLQMDKACAGVNEIYLSKAQANYLNGLGIVTALNFAGGWRAWGNRLSIYPSSTDPVGFIPVRRMIHFVGNTLITTYFARVDNPLNKRLIEAVTDSVQIWLNGLAARGAILGGKISFLAEQNPVTDMINGTLRFYCEIGFAVPAEVIKFEIEFDPDYYEQLFT